MTIDEALSQTLEDHRLSRGEKSALSKLFFESSTSHDVIRAKAFDLAREEVAHHRGDDRLIIDWLEGVVKALDAIDDDEDCGNREGFSSRAFFSPGLACVSCIQRLFQAIRHSADVCVFTITDDRIRDEMTAAQRRGVKIRVISDNDKSADHGSDIEYFTRQGIEVVTDFTDAHMHHKFAIFDRRLLLTGSYNWTRSAALENQENIALTEDSRLVRQYQGEFDRLWKRLSAVG